MIKDQAKYILTRSEEGNRALQMQHDMMLPHILRQLEIAGIKQGMVVWDVGCGNGAVTEILAEVVGKNGKVYAQDISPYQIEATRKRLESRGFGNVEYVQADSNSLDISLYPKADIIYSKLLLAHVNNPQELIFNMIARLKGGGALCFQESAMEDVSIRIGNPWIKRHTKAMLEYAKLQGQDYNIGERLEQILDNIPDIDRFEHFKSEYFVRKCKDLYYIRLKEHKDKLVGSGVISETDYHEITQGIREYFEDENNQDNTKYYQHHYIAWL